MIFNNEAHDIRAMRGHLLIVDIENEYIKATADDDIYMPEGIAYEEANEGSGQLVKLAAFSRLGVITDIGLADDPDNVAIKEGLSIGTQVYYVAQASTAIPIGPSTTVIRIPVHAVLGVVTPIV